MGTFHVLLVGIDAYPKRPLAGCVNDIAAIEALLLGAGLGITQANIKRLASPSQAGASAATLANIRDAFQRLASDTVQADHRVFVYYSGHGFRSPIQTPQGTAHREAIVPVDYDSGNLLFDHELNDMLAAIVARTRSVTVVLDCCHSAGVTRDPWTPGMVARCLEPGDVTFELPRRESVQPGLARGIEDCHVVSACLDHESAYESDGADGTRHGLLTRALIDAVSAIAAAERPEMTWGRIWESVREKVVSRNAAQHVWMAGNLLREVFAGPPTVGDAGFTITQQGGSFSVHAGEISGLTNGAEIAVYPASPAFFPPLDRDLRVGTLRVTSATASRATAVPVAPFPLPPAARGRLVSLGEAARLPCAITFSHPELANALADSKLLRVVDPEAGVVRIEQTASGWAITDDLHGVSDERPPLFTFARSVTDARELLEHYTRYVLPIQLANRANALAGRLRARLRLVSASLSPDVAQTALLPEVASAVPGEYDVTSGMRVAIEVSNTSEVDLRVTVVNSAASGRVQLLGDQVITKHSRSVFWAAGRIGSPFVMSPPKGRSVSLDRAIVIGRTSFVHELTYLRVDQSFDDLLKRTRGARDLETASAPRIVDEWAAHQVVLRTRG